MEFMRRALELARQALGSTSPNPAVGAVLVKDGQVVGEGFTHPPGGPHAEVVALRQAGEQARGATLYVTLEPCCHHGRTPPCTRAIIQAGAARVVMAILDPNPLVDGKGRAELEMAGIATSLGEGEAEALELTEAYRKWIRSSTPFVAAKYAMSLDGKTATATGESRWLTGPAARRYVHELRRTADAIMVGVNTVLRDDPRLTARDHQDRPLERQPLRIIVDSHGRTPREANVLRPPGRALVAAASIATERRAALEASGAEVLSLPAKDGRVDLRLLLEALGQQEITSVLAEGGGTLLASLVEGCMVDKVYAFIAPLFVGGRDAPTPQEGTGVRELRSAVRLERTRFEQVGEDWLLVGYPRWGD